MRKKRVVKSCQRFSHLVEVRKDLNWALLHEKKNDEYFSPVATVMAERFFLKEKSSRVVPRPTSVVPSYIEGMNGVFLI